MCYSQYDPGELRNRNQEGGDRMERQIPKNVRQTGNVSDSPKIYVEDYVDTFFLQLCEKSEKEEKIEGAFLIGEMQQQNEEEYIYIYGALRMQELKKEGGEYLISDKTWKRGYEECKQYFEDGEIIGWFVTERDLTLTPGAVNVKMHKKSFSRKNTVFVMKDSVNQEEAFFVHKLGDLMEIGGHYTYYEKNPCMQNYMIASRKKNGTVQTEAVEDTAAQSFRTLARERGGQHRRRKSGALMYGMSTCLVLLLVVAGVSMMSHFNRGKAQTKQVEVASGGETQTTSPEATETSGSVTAETEEPGTGTASQDTEKISTAQEDAEKTEDSTQSVEASAASVTAVNGSDGIYVVEKGDTLAIISKKMYGDLTHVDAISRMNGLQDGNLIYIGQKLILP